MSINSKDFRVGPGEKVKLREWPTVVLPFCKSKKRYQKVLGEHVEELSSLQRLHYASNRYALLLIFQGMDGAGKDGAIRYVMSGVDPQGCEVSSFKQPSARRVRMPHGQCPAVERRNAPWHPGILRRQGTQQQTTGPLHGQDLRN